MVEPFGSWMCSNGEEEEEEDDDGNSDSVEDFSDFSSTELDS